MKFTLGPNSSSPDLLDAIANPEKWVTPNCDTLDLDWWGFVSDEDQAKGDLPGWLGPNTYGAIKAVGLGVVPELYISGEGPKEHDPDGTKNESKWINAVLPRVQQAGGTIAAITLDEPLTSTVPGRHVAHRHYPFNIHEVHIVAAHTARVINAVGFPTVLYEAWPQHPADRISAFIQHVHDEAPLTRFVLDVDQRAIRSSDSLALATQEIETRCASLGIEFAMCGMAQNGPHATDVLFLQSLEAWVRIATRYADHVTIESWNEWMKQKAIPQTLPPYLAGTLAWADRTYNGGPEEPQMPSTTAINNKHQAVKVMASSTDSPIYQEVLAIYAAAGEPVPDGDVVGHVLWRLGCWRVAQTNPPSSAMTTLATLEQELSGGA